VSIFDGVFGATRVVTSEVDAKLMYSVLVGEWSSANVDVGCRR